MPTEVDELLADRLSGYFDLFVGSREPRFPHEREIRLFQFQNWIYFPEQGATGARQAGFLAATKILQRIEHKMTRGRKNHKGKASNYIELFQDETYAQLFDATFGLPPNEDEQGAYGWSKLINTQSASDFDLIVFNRIAFCEPAARMIDYMYRMLVHHSKRSAEANIRRAQFFIWKDKDAPKCERMLQKSLSARTIRARWSTMRASAVFLYVSELHEFKFFPRDLNEAGFCKALYDEANDTNNLTDYLSTCDHVGVLLSKHTDLNWKFTMPDMVTGSACEIETQPLSDVQLERISDYKMRQSEFADS